MSISSIKQNAQTIVEAYEVYKSASLVANKDSKQVEKIRTHILNLAKDILKKVGDLKENVR